MQSTIRIVESVTLNHSSSNSRVASMHDPHCPRVERRRFVISGLILFGRALLLGSVAVSIGCSDEKGPGQVENAGEVTKTPDAQDSMRASMEHMKAMQKSAGSQRR